MAKSSLAGAGGPGRTSIRSKHTYFFLSLLPLVFLVPRTFLARLHG